MEKTKMDFDVLTLFPEMFAALTQYGVTGRACEQQLTSVTTWNIRDFSEDSRKTVDDRAYGGGPGMVMMAKPLESCLEAVGRSHVSRGLGSGPVCLLSPQGEPFTQKLATDILNYRQLTLICGRYEAVDQRFIDGKVDLEISIGDFVVSGGELPAMILMDAVIRLIPGALGDEGSALQDSFMNGLLDPPLHPSGDLWK